jgi:phosphate-selective porin OprO/OprP
MLMRKSLVAAGLAALALVGGALAAPARAQQVLSLFYQEVEKDGRIYVFNTPERFKSFSESGEIGTAITLIGRAEGGLTLVAENETAADLYFFKHDLPGYERETPKPYKPPFEVTWKDGKTTFKTKTAEVSLSNRVQARYTYFDREEGEDIGTFNIRRAKTAIEGKTGDFKFKLQANWVGAGYLTGASIVTDTLRTTVRRGPELEDAEIWWAKHPMATIWVGQGKVPFGRQEYTSSGKQQFVDRWIGNALYAPGRDQGIRLEGMNESKTFEYAVGAYNGIARNINVNDNDDYLYSGRVAWMPFGEYKFEESSLDYPDSPKLALGLGAVDNTVGTGSSAVDVFRLGYEAAFKWRGFNVQGEFFDEEAENQSNVTSDNQGYYIQAGYLFPSKKFEIAARLENIERDTTFSVSNLASALTDFEAQGLGLSYYMNKHVNKIQGDYFVYEDKVTGNELSELRVQLQIIF